MNAASRKPKKLSKTKQEVRRLRAFAGLFLGERWDGIDARTMFQLRRMAQAAITGKVPS